MAPRYSLTEARVKLADIVSEAQYAGKVTIITRHGKDVAAIVPVVDDEPTEAKKPVSAASRNIPPRKSKA